MKILCCFVFMFCLLAAAPRSWADCSFPSTAVCNGRDCGNETRPEGHIYYNEDYKTHAACVNGIWRTVGPEGMNECTGSYTLPGIGDTCLDGSIYAGRTPDGNALMYTTPADAPGAYTWNDGSSNWLDTAMVNCTTTTPGTESSCQTGQSNTALLVALNGSGTPAPYAAAEYCNGLTAHGQSDWYLPAQDELNVLYTNRNMGNLNGTFNETGVSPAGHYWSSSERHNIDTRFQRFSDGFQLHLSKTSGLSVRCVRR